MTLSPRKGRTESPMPATFSKILLHLIFSTKNRALTIKPDLQDRLYAFIGGIVRDERGMLLCTGGTPDHVHLLVRWRTDAPIADLLRNMKSRSSKWLHETFAELGTFAWQTGHAVFSVSQSQCEHVRRYISDQAEHHRVKSFQEEFVEFLKAHEIEYDERYIWD
jgi:putative transposase